MLEVAVAVKIDLEGVDPGCLAVTQQVTGDLRGSAVPDGTVLACRRRSAGDRAELDPKAHPCRDRLAAGCFARPAQGIASLSKLGDRQRRRLPHRGEAGG